MNFEYNICEEFDCDPNYNKKSTGKDCNGKFDNKDCGFYGEHLILNCNNEGC